MAMIHPAHLGLSVSGRRAAGRLAKPRWAVVCEVLHCCGLRPVPCFGCCPCCQAESEESGVTKVEERNAAGYICAWLKKVQFRVHRRVVGSFKGSAGKSQGQGQLGLIVTNRLEVWCTVLWWQCLRLQRAVDFRSGHQVIANLVSPLQILVVEVKTECIPAQKASKERVELGRRVRIQPPCYLQAFHSICTHEYE
jgi:hypothetical protein